VPPTQRPTDIRIIGLQVYLLPIETRVPLKFGTETLTQVSCLRVRLLVESFAGKMASGWGETPLSVQWVWPSQTPYGERLAVLERFVNFLARKISRWDVCGHAFVLGVELLNEALPAWLAEFNSNEELCLPYLASLLVASAFDLAWHDAQGKVLGCDTYATYSRDLLARPLMDYFGIAETSTKFSARYLDDYLVTRPPVQLPVWHLVGALDPLTNIEESGLDPNDGYPVLLSEWIQSDGLQCLKIKLRGNDLEWDFNRIVQVANVGLPLGVHHLSTDFNCTVRDPAYVMEILDRLERDHPRIWQALAYVEQPFPYELSELALDVHDLARRKPLFLDESAHDWQHIRLGKELGWNGVALKTCKTQTGALLSLCWARANGMGIMVQDLTNPMLAQIPHVRLAAHAGTAWGVESNAMQYYPAASDPEAMIHPGLYRRRHGLLQLGSLADETGTIIGFGYRQAEACRSLPAPVFSSLD
jgi:L-alanine-DL-glutamate epimerase-like enolase superfamily enzyme